MVEVKQETPEEAYTRVYAEVLKSHGYRFTWNEDQKCVGVCACGGTSHPLPSRDEVSDFMGTHAQAEAQIAAARARRTLEELANHKAQHLIDNATVTDSKDSHGN